MGGDRLIEYICVLGDTDIRNSPFSGPDLVLGSGGHPLVGQPIQRPELVLLTVQTPGRVARVRLAKGQILERGDAVLVDLDAGDWWGHLR